MSESVKLDDFVQCIISICDVSITQPQYDRLKTLFETTTCDEWQRKCASAQVDASNMKLMVDALFDSARTNDTTQPGEYLVDSEKLLDLKQYTLNHL